MSTTGWKDGKTASQKNEANFIKKANVTTLTNIAQLEPVIPETSKSHYWKWKWPWDLPKQPYIRPFMSALRGVTSILCGWPNLSLEHKCISAWVCNNLLQCHDKDLAHFAAGLVIDDKTQLHSYEPGMKVKSVERNSRRASKQASKMATVFWDPEGTTLYNWWDPVTTNSTIAEVSPRNMTMPSPCRGSRSCHTRCARPAWPPRLSAVRDHEKTLMEFIAWLPGNGCPGTKALSKSVPIRACRNCHTNTSAFVFRENMLRRWTYLPTSKWQMAITKK